MVIYSATIQSGRCADVCPSFPGVGYDQPVVASLPRLEMDLTRDPGSDARPPVTVKTIVVPHLADLLATRHAIALHVFPGRLDACVACGAIRGVPGDGQTLFCDLASVGTSGVTGLVWLQDTAAGTIVTLSVGSRLRGSAARQAIQSAPITTPPRVRAFYAGDDGPKVYKAGQRAAFILYAVMCLAVGVSFLAVGLYQAAWLGHPAAVLLLGMGALGCISVWHSLRRLAYEIRLQDDGTVEFIHVLGTRRVAASDIWVMKRVMLKVVGEDGDPRQLQIKHLAGKNRVSYFQRVEQFIRDIQVRNPRVVVEGQWTTEEQGSRPTSGDAGGGERRHHRR